MSELDRMLELASHGTSRAQGQVPAKTKLNEGPGPKDYGQTGWDREWERDYKMHQMGSNNPNKDKKDDDDFKDQVAADDREQAKERNKQKNYRTSGSNPAGEFSESPEETQEAVGEFAEPIYDLCDELGCEDHPVLDELVRYLDGDTIKDFVADFRRHNDMNGDMEESPAADEASLEEATGVCEDCGCKIDAPVPGCECTHDVHDASQDNWVAEAKAKPDFADIDGDGDKDEDMKKAAKDMKKENKEELDESPTMDTTQLITLLKNSGLSEEAIDRKINEWANTPDGAAEEEATSHGDPYDYAQSVNLSLKRYLDAEDMKVGLKEHTVADLKEAYKKSKGE